MKKILGILIFLCNFNSLYANPIKVAIIDTGLNTEYIDKVPLCKNGIKDFTKEGLQDYHGHGTNITGIVVNNVKTKNYCIVLIKAFAYRDRSNVKQYIVQALQYAYDINADVINLSSGGSGSDTNERKIVLKILDKHIKLVAAAGNDDLDLDKNCSYYPACYDKRIFAVGNMGVYSNYGNRVATIPNDMGTNITAFGVTLYGTSQSTAVFTSKVINSLDLLRKEK